MALFTYFGYQLFVKNGANWLCTKKSTRSLSQLQNNHGGNLFRSRNHSISICRQLLLRSL